MKLCVLCGRNKMPDTFSNISENGFSRIVNLSHSSEIAIVMILAFLLLGIAIKNTKYIYIQHIKDLFGSTKYSQKFNTEKENSLSQIIILMLALLGFSFFFVLSFDYFNYQYTTFSPSQQISNVLNFFTKITITFVAIGLILWLQQLFLKFMAWLFSFDQNAFELVLRSYFLVIKLLGITLLIISFFFFYAPVSWQAFTLNFGFIIGFCVFLFLIIHYIRKIFSKFVFLFYFFLYLCTLKILPILVLRKLLIEAYKMV